MLAESPSRPVLLLTLVLLGAACDRPAAPLRPANSDRSIDSANGGRAAAAPPTAAPPTAAPERGGGNPDGASAGGEGRGGSAANANPESDAAAPLLRPSRFAAVPRGVNDVETRRREDAVDSRYAIAKRMLDTGQFADAEMTLRSMLAEHPSFARAEFFLALAVQKQKRYAEAVPIFERAIDAKTAFPEIDHLFHFLGWSEYYLGRMPEARLAFEEHIRRIGEEADSIFGLGLVAIEEGRDADAERHFRRAIELQRDDPTAKRDSAKAHARLGDVLLGRDDVAGAESEYRRAVTLWPNHYEAWAKLARALLRQGKSVEAERARAEEQAAMQRVGRASPEGGPDRLDGSAPPAVPGTPPSVAPPVDPSAPPIQPPRSA